MTVSDAHYTSFLLFPGSGKGTRAEKNRIGIHCRRSRVFSWSSCCIKHYGVLNRHLPKEAQFAGHAPAVVPMVRMQNSHGETDPGDFSLDAKMEDFLYDAESVIDVIEDVTRLPKQERKAYHAEVEAWLSKWTTKWKPGGSVTLVGASPGGVPVTSMSVTVTDMEVTGTGSNDQPERPADDNETLCQPCSDSWFPRPDVTVLSWYEFPRALREIGIDESDLKDKIFSEMLDGQHFLPHVVEKDIAEAFENFTQRYLAWQFLDGPEDTLFPDHVVTELLGVVNEIRVRHFFFG